MLINLFYCFRERNKEKRVMIYVVRDDPEIITTSKHVWVVGHH